MKFQADKTADPAVEKVNVQPSSVSLSVLYLCYKMFIIFRICHALLQHLQTVYSDDDIILELRDKFWADSCLHPNC